MTEKTDIIAPERVKELLSYDPLTGLFARKVPAGSRGKPGPVSGSLSGNGYLVLGILGKRIYLHRLAWALSYGEWPEVAVDHINCDKTNNRLSNLRHADKSQNGRNRGAPSNNRSGVKGVSWDRAKRKWLVTIAVHAKTHYVGRFADLDAAAAAHRKASLRLHGEFAN